MSIVRVEEDIQPLKYLVVTQQRDPESVITTNVVISDTRNNRINLVSIEKGPQGDIGPAGPKGNDGKDGVTFDVLPINSGGTNNTVFNSGHIIYYDGNKLSSTNYTIQDILNSAGSNSNLTGIIAESGLYVNLTNNNARLGIRTGDGLKVNEQNAIVVDDTIVRKVELSLGNISGVVPIEKGGTNNQLFNSNRLLYYDGFKIASFPLATGRILLSGTTIDIVAGSGLVGGGITSLPSGSVVLNIGGSSDILVESSSISLSNTGVAGTYNKITTDIKGRVVSGSNLTASDIINILQYTPWHAGNDGENSGLDADLLDGQHSSYYLDLANSTGTLNSNQLPIQSTPGLYSKVQVNDRGIVLNGQDINYGDVVNALGYRPVSVTGDTIYGPLTVNGDVNLNGNDLIVRDNLPLLGTNSPFILPNEPRGFSFMYGGLTAQTGILAYYPGERELRLITNIGASGIVDAGDGNNFNNEVDGGNANSIYVIGNITGDMNIVLLRSVADSLYVSLTNDQTISGNKIFSQPINVRGQVNILPSLTNADPPLNVGPNNRMVENLNADLLHGKNLDYYNDAANMTGVFDYSKVQFDYLNGTSNFIPRFDNRTSNPSRTISDSFIQQTGQQIRITNNANFSVGTSNTGSYEANRSALIGSNNKIIGDNSLAVGSYNLVNANNSIALNSQSQALTDNSIAAGSYGYTWSNNQVSFGAFKELTNTSAAQGQHSTITLGLNGTQSDGSWVDMGPVINIPKNKTLAYTLELLMNKAAGTGAAFFTFESGIIKNSTFRNPSNPSVLTNITSILKDHKKNEVYNDSQKRRYYYHFNLENNNFIQNLDVTDPNIRTLDVKPYNTESLYKYIPEYITANGTYSKTNDGDLVLNIPKPITYGWFYQNSGNPDIRVKSYFHGMTTGSTAQLYFNSASMHNPVSRQYEVSSIIDESNFTVKETAWTGRLTGNEIILDPYTVSSIDAKNSIIINGGYLYTNSPDIYNIPVNVSNIFHTGMFVKYYPYGSNYSYVIPQTGKIIALTNNSITFSTPFTGVTPYGQTLNTQCVLEFNSYSRHIFDSSRIVHVNVSGYGQQGLISLSGAYPKTYCGQPTYAIKVSGLPNNIFTDAVSLVRPAVVNTGTVSLISHRNITGTYVREPTQYKRYDGIYIRQPSVSGTSRISIYNKFLEPIDLPSVPFSYSLVCGYGDTDNNSFEIYKSGLYSYLKFKNNSINISRLGSQTTHFSTSYSVNSGDLGYVFYPAKLNNSDQIIIPTGFDPDVTYYPVDISFQDSLYSFNLSESPSGSPVSAIFSSYYESYTLFPRILDTNIKDNYNVRIKTSDMSGRNYEKAFIISVDNIEVRNHIRNFIPDQYAVTGELFTFEIPGNTFPANTTISSIVQNDGTSLPSWLMFNSGIKTFSGIPLPTSTGTLNLIVKATGNQLVVSDSFKLTVTDGSVGSSRYINDPVNSFQINNLNISNISVPKNISYDTTVGKLFTDGGYKPYITFHSSSNSFSGKTHAGGNVLTECFATSYEFDTATLYGNIPLLVSGNNININSYSNGLSQKIFHRTVSPISFGVVINSGSNFLQFNQPNNNYSNIIFSGNRIYSNNQGWDNNYYVDSVSSTGIVLNRVFTNTNSESTGLTCFTSGYNIVLDSSLLFSDNIVGVFNTPVNESGFYYIDELKNFTSSYRSSSRCFPTQYKSDNHKGFDTEATEYISNTGYYSTGLVSFYSDAGFNKITIFSPEDLNFENNENSVYLNFKSTSNGALPTSQQYPNISGINVTNFSMDNGYFFPNIQPYSTGSVLINVDKNHGFKLTNNYIINQIPIQFLGADENNSNRQPKNNLFDIINIEGNNIFVQDKNNYLLKEAGKPDYFDQPINGSYSTNGFGFNAAFVHNDYRIYDLNYDGLSVWPQDKILDINSSLGCANSGFVSNSKVLDFTNGFYFDGTISRNAQHIVYNGTFPSTVYPGYKMSVYSSGSFWPTDGVLVNYNGYNYAPLNVSFNESAGIFNTYGQGIASSPLTILCTGNNSSLTSANLRIVLLGYDYQVLNINGLLNYTSGSSFSINKIGQNGSQIQLFSSSSNSNINIQVTGFPKEVIEINLSKNTDQPLFASLNLNISSTFDSTNIGKRLELANTIGSINTDYIDARFYFKPIITLDQKVCLNSQSRSTNNRVFFNGNQLTINNLSTPRSYLNTNDQIKILSLNNSNNFIDSTVSRYAQIVSSANNNTVVYAIPMNGPKAVLPNSNYSENDLWRRNTQRYSYSFGLKNNEELPNNGTISFIGSVSGRCSIPYYNNLYYHTYGGFTANWPMDPYGKAVPAPLTGVFSLQSNSSQCSSGVMCLNIKGFSTTNFNNIPDLVNRSNIGRQSHVIDSETVDGYVRPWGIANKTYYFDFTDGAPELNGSYYINDKIDPYNITINLPYNPNYLGRSGLVYIIDSQYNVKTNVNPNIDNTFVLSNPDVAVYPDTQNPVAIPLVDSTINSYSPKSKRWKHLVHFNNDFIPYSGYNLIFNNNSQNPSQLLYLNPDKINIINVDYSMDLGENYNALENNDTINIKTTDEGPIYLRIQTKDGSQKWSQTLLLSAPRINIYGINTYEIDTNTISYDSYNKVWTLTAIIDNIKSITNNRNFSVLASDETGSVRKNLYINVTKIPEIKIPKTTYTYVNSPISWLVNYDIKYLPNPALIVMSGYPGPNFNISPVSESGIRSVYGSAGSVTGIFNTTLFVKDYITGENLTSQTGIIRVLAMNESKPEYSLQPVGLDNDDIYLNIDNDNNSASFSFYIEAINESNIGLLVNLTPDPDNRFTRNIFTEYSNDSNRFKITVDLTGNAGYYPNKAITIEIKQPQVNSNDEITWVTYNYTKIVNITLYKNLMIDRYTLPQPLSFDKKEPWFLQFYLLGGIYSHRPDITPSVRLSDAPNKGTYPIQPLEYDIKYEYDDVGKRWKIIATSRTDSFGNTTDSIGVKTIKIFAEDTINTTYDDINITFTQNKYLANLQSVIYSVPNQPYQTTFDVKQATANQGIIINVPPQLKENPVTIDLSHKQYDPNLSLHELSYSGSPIYDKWDSTIDFNNINMSLNDNQTSSMTVKCKGIASDKIYAVGKLSLLELDSLTIPGLPIKITGVTKPYYNAKEGARWRITFKTVYGLENPNFPPTILLSGLPTVCSGYYPSFPLEQQNGCLEYRNWNPSDKSWNFAFTGFPLCGIDGVKPFSITAIDTDTVQNISLGYDYATGSIKYASLQEDGFDHPSPQIVPVGQVNDPIALYPRCNTPMSVSYKFGTVNRDTCPIPTGITGWIVSSVGGNNLLPSGLSYTISFPGGNPKRPWNNLGSGTLTITGNPSTFANGGEYAEKLVLTVYDARNKSAQKIIKFTDASSANPPSPADVTIYFAQENPVYTKRRNQNPGEQTVPALGTAPIDYQYYPNIPYMYWPAANSGALRCDSILPHNQCPVSYFSYAGGDYQSFDFKVLINPYSQILTPNSTIYVEFDNNQYNGRYNVSVQYSPNLQYYITIPGHTLTNGTGKLVKERITSFSTYDMQKFAGNTDLLSTKYLLGCGQFASKSSYNIQEGGYGIFGRMYPSIKATIPNGVAFSSQTINSSPSLGLDLNPLNNVYVSGAPQIYTIKTSDCWQTGYLRVSGILLPAPTVELTDPAPASEAPFAYNGQQYYVGSRCVYGNNQEERNLLANKRDVNINYILKNMLNNTVYQNSNVSSSQAIAFSHTETIGTVFSLFINNNPSSFPTYNGNAIPYAQNEYFWIHKAGTKNETITQNSFPPVIIGGLSNIYATSGSTISGYLSTAIGGYIPFNEYSIPVPYYRLPDGNNWSTIDYTPIITGVAQTKVSPSYNIEYSHFGWSNQSYQYIKSDLGSNPYDIQIGDTIYISFPGSDIIAQTLTISNANIVDNSLLIPYSRTDKPPINNAQAIFSFLCPITEISPNYIAIKHKNLSFNNGDSIDLSWSLGSTLNNIVPSTDKLEVLSSNNTGVVLSYSGSNPLFSSGLSTGLFVDIYKNYHNQINISALTFSKEGYWLFGLSGTPTDLYKDYRYKIITCENTGMPVFIGTNLTPKKYSSIYNLYVSKPIKILLDNNYEIPKNNGAWTLTFSVDGGSRPITNYTPEVMINNNICNFNRALNPVTMQDSYDATNDRWNITISNNNNYDWRPDSFFELKVFDNTGVDTKTISFISSS